jgi:hypothetical protein
MKRLWILSCMLAIAVGSLSAEPFLLLGGSMGYTSQNDAAQHLWSAASVGLLQQSYVDLTPAFGLYSAATIGFIIQSQDNGIALDVGQYQTFGLNILLGIGYRMAFEKLTGLAAAGVYFGSTMLNATNYSLSSFDAGGAGVGIGASLLYSPAFNWGIGANVNAAYYLMIPGNAAPTMAPSGISVFGGLGVVFFYQSNANLPSGVTRFSSESVPK